MQCAKASYDRSPRSRPIPQSLSPRWTSRAHDQVVF